MRNLILALSAFGLLAASVPSIAATHCRDAKGKFIKCANKAPVNTTKCRDPKGHFTKCGTPGAKPA
jgi:ribosomal protein L40E